MDYKYPTVEAPKYSKDEIEYRGYLINRLEQARDLRNQTHPEFDDMSYPDYFETNSKATNGYIPPKKNPEDVRIVTGVTQEKVETFVSALLNYNLLPNIRAFDQDEKEVRELGENLEALILKSYKLEKYDEKRPLIYKEAASQGDAFVEEVLLEYREIEKALSTGSWNDAINLTKNWTQRKKLKLRRELVTNQISGLNLYVGNIRDFYIETQPYIFTRELKTYEECKGLFGTWKRFENVPARVSKLTEYIGEGDLKFNDWSLEETKEGFVEVIKYQDKPNDEQMIILNGVMMLPVGFPLSAMLGKKEYTISKFALFPISRHFFYSKGVTAKTKVDQAILDEFYKMFVVKTQKSVKPPMANNTGRHLSNKIFMPSAIVDDLDGTKIQEIGENGGVTQSEFAFLEYIKNTIDNKSFSPIFEGQSVGGAQTATEISALQKQSLQKMGLAVYGAINFEKQRARLRLANIVTNWTKVEEEEVDEAKQQIKEVYKRFEIEDDMGGSNGVRMIEMTTEPKDSAQLLGMEKVMARTGRKVKIVHINPEELRKADLMFDIEIIPTPTDSDALDKAQFREDTTWLFGTFGPQAFNAEYFKDQALIKAKLDPDKAKLEQQMPQGMPPEMAGQMPQGPVNSQLNQAVQGRQPSPSQPSINTLASA